ncbi:hypothetical protein [Paramicrobacterium agarici]|uniref:hypothetical protein n=1 Tax=Paramicrobacterium agarici TaxID=630514 RepID=UPI00116CFA14|nr:hypothetical protein [Microbacterium agarici]TQO23768.1 hypothetical protein FB385_2628 [Microbacterium agarici]
MKNPITIDLETDGLLANEWGPTVMLGTPGSYDVVNVPLDELDRLIERLSLLRDSFKSQ